MPPLSRTAIRSKFDPEPFGQAVYSPDSGYRSQSNVQASILPRWSTHKHADKHVHISPFDKRVIPPTEYETMNYRRLEESAMAV